MSSFFSLEQNWESTQKDWIHGVTCLIFCFQNKIFILLKTKAKTTTTNKPTNKQKQAKKKKQTGHQNLKLLIKTVIFPINLKHRSTEVLVKDLQIYL